MRLHLQYVDGFDSLDAFVRIFLQQGLQNGAGLIAVPGEVVTLLHVFGSFTACQRRLVEGNVADQVKWIKVSADQVG